jgi:hypothetical protein
VCDEADCVMVTAFCRFWLLLYINHCNLCEIVGPMSSFMHLVDQLCRYSETIFTQQSEYISCNLIIPHLLDSFFPFHFACLICICIIFRFTL